jgi:hypothetical protein
MSEPTFSFVTSYGSAYVLGILFGKTRTVLSTYYIGLCTILPDIGDDGSTITEPPVAQAYQRAAVPNDAAHWDSSGFYEMLNAQPITWQVGDVSWGSITAFAILDEETPQTGNLLFCGRIQPGVLTAPLAKIVVATHQMAITATSLSSNFQPI